jgi:NAD+ kinase
MGMRVVLTGGYPDDTLPALERAGFEVVGSNPDLVITRGGDGALLGAERAYPLALKFPILDTRRAPLCPEHSLEKQLEALAAGNLKTFELMKLEGRGGGKKLQGMNDVFIHNVRRVAAIRYRVWIDGELYAPEVVGDGAGVATVHGSTAYYRSITHSVFRTGIGLAFSNSTEVTNHLVLPEDSVIRIKILRGPALMVADNDPDSAPLGEGDEAEIRASSDKARILGLDIFMCKQCRALRHSRK